MAMAIVRGAFFSTLFEKLFDKLGSSEYVNFFRESKVNERLLKKLQITLMSKERTLVTLPAPLVEESRVYGRNECTLVPKECKLESLDQLQCKLKEELKEKKFLIVLDDVWNEKYEHWDVLTSPFQSGSCGSKVIVTTRSDKVVKVMGKVQTNDLGELSDDDCWRLFSELVFGNANSDSCQGLREICKEIVKKCKGLPLAVKALGGLLRSVKDREEWQKILKNNIWELQLEESTSNNILPLLWLSYYYLPSHPKRCFTYCSISLCCGWQKGKRTLDVGDEFFQDLVARSLFQRSSN